MPTGSMAAALGEGCASDGGYRVAIGHPSTMLSLLQSGNQRHPNWETGNGAENNGYMQSGA